MWIVCCLITTDIYSMDVLTAPFSPHFVDLNPVSLSVTLAQFPSATILIALFEITVYKHFDF